MKSIVVLAAVIFCASGFVGGAMVGPPAWHSYCFPHACPKIDFISFEIIGNGEPAVTIKKSGVYFGRRYNRDREAKLLADAARQAMTKEPWPYCQNARYHFPDHGVIGGNFGTANPPPARKEEHI